MMKAKIVIIGAGPAGLSAAWELVMKAGEAYEVTVLEAADSVGGMAKSVLHNGSIMDVGGHRFFSKEKAVLDWWKAIFNRKEDVSGLLLRNRKVSIFYRDKFFDYPVALSLENMRKLGFWDTWKVGRDYIISCAKPRKEDTLEDFYINRFGKKLYSMFFENYTRKLCGVHPEKISPEWGEQRVRGLSAGKILKKDFSGKGWQTREGLLSPSLFYYPKYGPGQLWEMVAEDIEGNGGKIHFNCQVISLHQNEDGKIDFVMVQGENGEEKIEGDIFMSSMPIREMVTGMNLVPAEVVKLAETLPYRSFVSIGLWVDKLKMDVPDCWIYVHDERVKVCRIQFYHNWSPYLAKHDAERRFIALEYFCDEGDEFWQMSEEECMRNTVSEAILLGIIEEKAEVFDWHIEKIPQAYPGYHGSYKELEKIKDYLQQVENLFCIGRNGQHKYWNMDKCMISAWNVVEDIRKKYED